MSLTFTITPHSSPACNYAGISSELLVPRQAIDFDAGANVMVQYRCHASGVAGNWLIRDAMSSRRIRVLARYMNATAVDADTMYQNDCAALAIGPAVIVALGYTYTGCNLDLANAKRTRSIKATGRHANQCYFDVVLPFIQDNP